MSADENDNFWTKLVTFVAKPAAGIEPTAKHPVHRALHDACMKKGLKSSGIETATELLAVTLLRVENSKNPLETCKALHASLQAMHNEGKVTGQKVAAWYKRQLSRVPYLAQPEGEDVEHYVSTMQRYKKAGEAVGVVVEQMPMVEQLAVAHGQKLATQSQSGGAQNWLARVGASIGLNKPQR